MGESYDSQGQEVKKDLQKKKQNFVGKYGVTPKDPKRLNLTENVLKDFKETERMQTTNFMMHLYERWKKPQRHRLLMKAEKHLDRELELARFLKRTRLQTTAMLGLLTPKQRLFAEKSSNIVVDVRTSDTGTSDSDGESRLAVKKGLEASTKRLIRSKDKTDRRFVNMYRVNQTVRCGVALGFKGFDLMGVKDASINFPDRAGKRRRSRTRSRDRSAIKLDNTR